MDSGGASTSMGGGSAETFLRELARTPVPGALPMPGDRVGRFEILRPLGEGAWGCVYEARDTELGRHVAVKVLRLGADEAVERDRLLGLFRAEAAMVAELSHPSIVTLHDFGSERGVPYLVLELLRGETLEARLRRGPLEPRDAVELLLEVARALAHAHRHGLVHRDLKPANVFCCGGGRAKLLDFGIAHMLGAHDGPRTDARAGTPAYMAPEQWRGEAQDQRVDLFAAGAVLYECLTGRRVQRDDLEREKVEVAIPAELRGIVARTLAQDPRDRFASADELASALVLALRDLGQEAPGREQPYRYLEAFTEVDEAWFFGRAADTARLCQLVASRALVAVVGPSGAGKSSLLRAGLVPRLRADRPRWTWLILRPGREPLARLRAHVLEAFAGARALDELPSAAALAERPGRLGLVLRACARERATRVLLVVDPLEEVVTLARDRDERRAFLRALLSAADDPDEPTRVVCSLRDDFLVRLAEEEDFADALGSGALLLAPPAAPGLAEALRGPAERAGYTLEPAACEEILRDLATEPAPLPLLQLAASRLWEHRDETTHRLTRAALVAMGGVGGVLAHHAEEVLRGLGSADAVEMARRILCELTTPLGTRRVVPVSELTARLGDGALVVLERLVSGRIVTASASEGARTIELVHESLLRGWTRLGAWVSEERESRHARERLAQAAALWEEQGRPKELLWSGRPLELLDAVHLATLHAGERAFLEASRGRQRQRRRRNALLRYGLLGLAAAALVASLSGLRTYREAARAARVHAILQSADGADDALRAALLLRELPASPEPPGAAAIAHRLLRRPIPLSVASIPDAPIAWAALSDDGRRVLTWSEDRVARRFDAEGRGVPLRLGETPVLRNMERCGDRALVAAGADGSVTLLRTDAGRPPSRLVLGERPVLVARCDRENTRLAAGTADGALHVVPIGADGKLLGSRALRLRAHEAAIWDLDFSPDGRRIVAGSEDGTARVFELGASTPPRVLVRGDGTIRHARFAEGGARIVTANDAGLARVTRLDGGGTTSLRGHEGRILALAFSPDGTGVVTGGADATARIWRLDGASPAIVLRGHDGAIGSVAFTPDGAHVVTGSGDGTARLWRADGVGPPRVFARHAQGVGGARIDGNGRRLVTQGEDGTARVWPLRAELAEIPRDAQAVSTRLVFSPDGARAAIVGVDAIARIFSLRDEAPVLRLRSTGRRFWDLVFAPGGRMLTTAFDGTLGVWDEDGRARTQVRLAEGGATTSAAELTDLRLSDDGRIACVVARDGRAWRWSGGAPVRLPNGGAIARCAVAPDGRRLYTAEVSGPLHQHAAEGGGAPVLLARLEGRVTALGVSPRGDRLLAAAGRTAALFTLDGGARLELRGHGDEVLDARFDETGARVVTASADRHARLFVVERSEPTSILRHDGAVRSAVFAPDGRAVATASTDGRVRVFGARDGALRLEVEAKLGPLAQVAWSGDGRHLGAVSDSGYVHLERVRRWPELVARLKDATTACLRPETRRAILGEDEATSVALHARCEGARDR